MTLFYLGAGISLVLAVSYLIVGTLSFLRIRRQLADGTGVDATDDELDSSEVALVPGFTWKATLAVLTSLVVLIIASVLAMWLSALALKGRDYATTQRGGGGLEAHQDAEHARRHPACR